MTGRVETRTDGTTLVVRIPMRFQRRGGRKRIVAADGSELVPAAKPQPDGTLVKALARAWRWQRLLDDGVYTSVTEIAEAERIGKSYISRILRLALLAPDVVEGIVEGRADQALMLETLERPLPADWAEQRRVLLMVTEAEPARGRREPNVAPSYNAAPTRTAAAVRRRGDSPGRDRGAVRGRRCGSHPLRPPSPDEQPS